MASIVQQFDCKNQEHVLWLKSLGKAMAMVTNDEKCDILKVMNDNPMGVKIKDFRDFAMHHFTLCMKYANAVLNNDAFVPAAEPTKK